MKVRASMIQQAPFLNVVMLLQSERNGTEQGGVVAEKPKRGEIEMRAGFLCCF